MKDGSRTNGAWDANGVASGARMRRRVQHDVSTKTAIEHNIAAIRRSSENGGTADGKTSRKCGRKVGEQRAKKMAADSAGGQEGRETKNVKKEDSAPLCPPAMTKTLNRR